MSTPIEDLIGWTLGEALNHMVPAEVVCGRCQFSLAAENYHEHRTQDCPGDKGKSINA